MVTDNTISNIFQPRNDWAVRTLNCRKYNYNDFEKKLRNIVWGVLRCDPFLDPKYRGRNNVKARYMFMVMMVYHSGRSYEYIGNLFKKDHSTVSHALKTVSDLCFSEKDFKYSYDLIESKVKQII